MLAHLPLLVSEDAHIASRQRMAEQNKARILVFDKVFIRMIVFDRTLQQPSCAGQASPLVTDRRQINSVRRRGIPYILLLSTVKGANALRRLQHNAKASLL